MTLKNVCLIVTAVMIQSSMSQLARNQHAPSPYANEMTAANLAADAAALANGLAYPGYAPALAYTPLDSVISPGIAGLTYGLSLADLSASKGGGLLIKSESPIASTGVTVETDSMVIEGPLAITGKLPFLGAVALEGPLPATGTGTVAYECGDGHVGIVTEGAEPAPAYPSTAAGYPNGALAQGFLNGPLASGYTNGYPNAGLPQYANTVGPGAAAYSQLSSL